MRIGPVDVEIIELTESLKKLKYETKAKHKPASRSPRRSVVFEGSQSPLSHWSYRQTWCQSRFYDRSWVSRRLGLMITIMILSRRVTSYKFTLMLILLTGRRAFPESWLVLENAAQAIMKVVADLRDSHVLIRNNTCRSQKTHGQILSWKTHIVP